MLGRAALGASAIQPPRGELPPAQPKPAGEPTAPKVEAKGHVDHEGFALPPEAIARIGSARFRSGGYIQALGDPADGKTILVIDRDGRGQLSDTKSGAFRQPVEVKGATQTCPWNPDA